MKADRGFFHLNSIRAKILTFAALPIALMLAGLMTFMATRLYHHLEMMSHVEMDRAVTMAAEKIDKWNLKAVTVAEIMALAQQNGLFGRREASMQYARQVLESHPQFTGTYYGYEPNADGQDAVFLQQADPDQLRACDPRGRFIPYWFRDREDPTIIKLEPLVDMETSFYYQGVKNRVTGQAETRDISLASELSRHYVPSSEGDVTDDDRQVMITEPYVYEGKLIYEQTFPILIDGRFVGIAGIDRALTDVHRELEAIKPYETAEFVLISRRGRIISATYDSNLNSLPVEQVPMSDTLLSFYLSAADSSVQAIKEKGDTGAFFYQSAKIPHGRWTLVMRVEQSEILDPVHQDVNFRVSVGFFVLAFIVTVLWIIANKLTQRIARAVQLAGQVAQGDLTAEVEVTDSDETGQLLASIKTMIQNLNRLIGQVKRSSIQLMSTATRISAGAKTQENSVQGFGSSTNQIAVAVNEISATSQELFKTMGDVTNSANETAELAGSGRNNLQSMQDAMQRLVKANSTIASKLSVIHQKAQNISGVVTTINKVADQTNLLSLNAAIEAEKAGEYGQGFAVVAREIRRLADQTAVATLDIDRMVREMQSSVSAGVMEMDKFTDQIRCGVDEVGKVGSQLGGIIENVQDLTGKFDQVEQGMSAQTDGARQISGAMGQLTEAAHTSSASISEFKQATDDLHRAVGELRNEITNFKVADQ